MGELGIAGRCGRRKIRTTWRDPAASTGRGDLVERDFTADEPDELWVGDITYIPTDEGWLFVASVLDVCTPHGGGLVDRRSPSRRAVHRRPGGCRGQLGARAPSPGRCSIPTMAASTPAASSRRCCQRMGITQSMGTVGDSLR